MRQAIRLAIAVVILAVVPTTAPAGASTDDVLVRFGLSVGGYAPGACPLFVPEGTSGVGVLTAAVEAQCIGGFEMDGGWLRCLSPVGGAPVCSDVHKDPLSAGTHYWAIYEDAGAVAPHGVADFTAGVETHSRLFGTVPVGHTELVLSFESWVKCLAWPVLCNPDV